jgi:hypothetical protein
VVVARGGEQRRAALDVDHVDDSAGVKEKLVGSGGWEGWRSYIRAAEVRGGGHLDCAAVPVLSGCSKRSTIFAVRLVDFRALISSDKPRLQCGRRIWVGGEGGGGVGCLHN